MLKIPVPFALRLGLCTVGSYSAKVFELIILGLYLHCCKTSYVMARNSDKIKPTRLKAARREDGTLWILGSGANGTVCSLPSVTALNKLHGNIVQLKSLLKIFNWVI